MPIPGRSSSPAGNGAGGAALVASPGCFEADEAGSGGARVQSRAPATLVAASTPLAIAIRAPNTPVTARTTLATATRALLLEDDLAAAAVPGDSGSRGTTERGAGVSIAGSLAKAESSTPLSIATRGLLMEVREAAAVPGDSGSRVTSGARVTTVSGTGSSGKAKAGTPASTTRRPGARQIASSIAASIRAASSITRALSAHRRGLQQVGVQQERHGAPAFPEPRHEFPEEGPAHAGRSQHNDDAGHLERGQRAIMG